MGLGSKRGNSSFTSSDPSIFTQEHFKALSEIGIDAVLALANYLSGKSASIVPSAESGAFEVLFNSKKKSQSNLLTKRDYSSAAALAVYSGMLSAPNSKISSHYSIQFADGSSDDTDLSSNSAGAAEKGDAMMSKKKSVSFHNADEDDDEKRDESTLKSAYKNDLADLHTVQLVNCDLLDDDIATIIQAMTPSEKGSLKHMPPMIQTLNLCANDFSQKAFFCMSSFLKFNQTLEVLVLSRNSISDSSARLLSDGLRVNRFLKELILNSSDLSDIGVSFICDGLSSNSSLTGLSLDGNPFGKEGTISVSNLLRKSRSVFRLTINYGRIGKFGLLELCEALEVEGITLAHLELMGNKLDDESAVCIAEMLTVNKSLVSINLADNVFQDAGTILMTESLRVNNSVTELDFRNNLASSTGIAKVIEILSDSMSLQRISFGKSYLGKDQLKKILKRNRKWNRVWAKEVFFSFMLRKDFAVPNRKYLKCILQFADLDKETSRSAHSRNPVPMMLGAITSMEIVTRIPKSLHF